MSANEPKTFILCNISRLKLQMTLFVWSPNIFNIARYRHRYSADPRYFNEFATLTEQLEHGLERRCKNMRIIPKRVSENLGDWGGSLNAMPKNTDIVSGLSGIILRNIAYINPRKGSDFTLLIVCSLLFLAWNLSERKAAERRVSDVLKEDKMRVK